VKQPENAEQFMENKFNLDEASLTNISVEEADERPTKSNLISDGTEGRDYLKIH
jgi:hypothetical protein